MRISYNILWVEDDKQYYEANLELIDDFLDDNGFEVKSKLCRNFGEVEAEYQNNHLKEYDIMFIDFNLDDKVYGSEIIEFIRSQDDNSILTDVIFYSSDIESVRDKLKENGFEGVYTSPRTEFIGKAEKVILSTIKKVQEVNPIRGLIMAETSDLDNLMLEIINKMLLTEHKETYEDYIKSEVESTIIKNTKLANDENNNINDKISDSRIFTTFHKAKCINKLYKQTKTSENPIGKEKFFSRYDENVISVRNNFAHVKEEIRDGEKVLISYSTGKEIVFNESECIKIRKSLIEFRKELEEINSKL